MEGIHLLADLDNQQARSFAISSLFFSSISM